ncbi:MAG: hypothetical protein AB7G15_12330 [Alphaproteobacteria bacterium]
MSGTGAAASKRFILGAGAACGAILLGIAAWAGQPVEFRPPPDGLAITYDDGRTYTFGPTVDRLTEYTVAGPDLPKRFANMPRDVFFFAGEQTEHYRYGYDYTFERGQSIWPLDDKKVLRATYTYSIDGAPAGTGTLTVAAGSPETTVTPAGAFAVRRVMAEYESRSWRGERVNGTAVCLYAPAVGYCIGLGAMEFGKPLRIALATKIVAPSGRGGGDPKRR